MNEWIALHWYLVVGALVFVIGALALWRVARNSSNDESKSIWSLLLVWPLLFEQERKAKIKTRGGFVVAGLLVMLLLVVGATVFLPHSR